MDGDRGDSKRVVRVALASVMLVPLAVVTEPGSETRPWTTLTFGGGGARYADVARGCNGEVIQIDERSVREYGAELRHEFGGAPVIGLRASVQDLANNFYVDRAVTVNPYGAMEWKYFGAGVGWFYSPDLYADGSRTELEALPISGHIRFGRRDWIHGRISVLENPQPFLTGPFEFTIGTEGGPGRLGLSLGVAAGGPFDKPGFLVHSDIPVGERFAVVLSGRFGSSEGVAELGIAASIRMRFPHARAARDSS